MNSIHQYHLRNRRMVLFLVLISLLVVGCSPRTATGVLVGVGVALSLDDAAEGVNVDLDSEGRIAIVELEDGSRVDALCGERLWSRLQVGQELEVRPIEDSDYWHVVYLVDAPAKKTEPILRVEEISYSDFFPIEPGMEWLYRIEVEDGVEPVRYREQYWSFNEALEDWSRVTARASIRDTSREEEERFLQIRVKGLAKDSLPSFISICEAPVEVAELEIVTDDLLVFEGAKQVFWVKCLASYQGKPLSFIDEIVTYDLRYFSSQGIPGSNPTADGYSVRPVFFTAGIGLSLSETLHGLESTQSLTLQGPVDTDEEASLFNLRFRRVIEQEGKPGIIEDVTFAWKRGMIELRQDVEGQTSMTWALLRFTQE